MTQSDPLYYITYTGNDVVTLGKEGVFQNGTSAYVSETAANAARSRGDFTVSGPIRPAAAPAKAEEKKAEPAKAAAPAPAKAEEKKPDEEKKPEEGKKPEDAKKSEEPKPEEAKKA